MNTLVTSALAPVQINMFGLSDQEDAASRQNIIQHALAVVQNFQQMRESALKLCLALYMCREEFKASGDEGWTEFCKQNFVGLGLSLGNIRSAVQSGRAISRYISAVQDRGETADIAQLELMSRSALITLGEAPEEVRDELIDRVAAANEMRGKALTAREVSDELAQVKREKEMAEKGLAEAAGKISAMDSSLARMNALVRDRETQADTLQTQIDALRIALEEAKKNPPIQVQDTPADSKAALKSRQELDSQIAALKHEQDQVQAELAKEKAELARLAQQARAQKQSVVAIDELRQAIQRIKALWSDAYAQKVKALDPHTNAPQLAEIANDMRILADQLDPTLV